MYVCACVRVWVWLSECVRCLVSGVRFQSSRWRECRYHFKLTQSQTTKQSDITFIFLKRDYQTVFVFRNVPSFVFFLYCLFRFLDFCRLFLWSGSIRKNVTLFSNMARSCDALSVLLPYRSKVGWKRLKFGIRIKLFRPIKSFKSLVFYLLSLASD